MKLLLASAFVIAMLGEAAVYDEWVFSLPALVVSYLIRKWASQGREAGKETEA